MKQHHRILTAALAVPLLVTSIVLPSCHENDTSDTRLVEPVAVDHVWKSEYVTLPDDITGQLEQYYRDGDAIIFPGYRVLNPETYETENVTVTFRLNDHSISYTSAADADGSSEINQIGTDGMRRSVQQTYTYADGTLELLWAYNTKSEEETYELRRKDADQNALWTIDLQQQFDSQNRGWFHVQDIVVDSVNGTIYASADSAIVAFDGMGTRLYEVSADGNISSLFAAGDDKVYATGHMRNPQTGSYEMTMCPMDDAVKGFGDPVAVPASVDLQNANVYGVEGYDLCYSNDTGFYAWNFDDAEATLLCNWMNSDLGQRDLGTLVVLSEELILRRATDPVSGSQQIAVMTPVPPDEVTPKYLIEVGHINNGSDMLAEYALAFNRSSDKYRVVFRDYSGINSEGDDFAFANALDQDIISGNAPDIVFDQGYFNLINLAEKGAFLDLYTYMDADDAILSRKDFLPSVLTPFENKNGTLSILVSGFALNTLFARTEDVGEKTILSIEDAMALSSSLEEGTYLFAMYLGNSNAENAPPPALTVLNTLLPYSLSAFIDEKNAVCTFDDGRFAALLQFCENAAILNTAGTNISTDAAFRNGNLVFDLQSWLMSPNDYLRVKYYDFENTEMTHIGYPTADTTLKNAAVMAPASMWAISKDSPVADGAWEFITSTFGDVMNDMYYRMHSFPTCYGALEAMFKEERLNYTVFRENGSSGTSVAEGEEFILEENEWLYEKVLEGGVFAHMEPEDEAELLDILENVSLVQPYDMTLTDMIKEDVSAYFAGAKTLEETVKLVQSRVSIYVSEKQG